MNNIIFIVLSIIAILLVINSVRRHVFSIKESFWWFLASILMLLLSIFPYSIDWVATELNIAYPPSLLFILCIVFLVFINFRSSKLISNMQMKLIDLAQEVSILKSEINKKNLNK